MVPGVTRRAIAALADHELEFRPQPGMRSPRELVFHIYTQEQFLAEAARQGRFTPEMAGGSTPEDLSAAAVLSRLLTVRDVLAYVDECHQAAERIFRSMSEADVARPVERSEERRVGKECRV